MVLDCFLGDAEPRGDVLVAQALGHEIEDLGLAVAEHVQFGVVGLVVFSDAAEVFGSPVRTLGTVDSQMMIMNSTAAPSQVQVGLPLRACTVLK